MVANKFRKHLISVSLGLSMLLLTACGQTARAATLPTSATYYWLMVINGTGGGHYQAGTTVHIWANPHPKGTTFDVWKGQTQPLPDIYSMHAMITMPAHDVEIEATYTEIPAWSASYAKMFERDVYYYFPSSSYKGVIVFFHGSGGDAREWTDLGAERRHFFDDAIADGYAVLAINSLNRVDKQWNLNMPPSPNSDLDAVGAILKSFQAGGLIPAHIPVYGVGISRGGRFATLAAYELGMKATAIWVGLGHEEAIDETTVPTLWCLADHDPIIDREEAFDQYEQLIQRGVHASFYVHSQTPLYPLYFVNNEGVDEDVSMQLFSDLRSQGFLDENYFLTENPRISRWEKHVGLDYSETVRRHIQDSLYVAFAEHAFYSDCDHRVLDFLNAHP